MSEMIRKCEQNCKTELVIVMTDLKNAFGSVRHSFIMFALNHYKFDQNFIELVSSFYDGHTFRLSFNDEVFTINQHIGVFQCDVLSPVSFLIAVNLLMEPPDVPTVVSRFGGFLINSPVVLT
ncbi:hypothetical protein RCL1_009136 [Eukaryota sp. TZLM3-RCL]